MRFCTHWVSLFLVAVGHRDGAGLPEERQHGALLPQAGVGGDQVLPGGHDEPRGQQTRALPAPRTPQVCRQSAVARCASGVRGGRGKEGGTAQDLSAAGVLLQTGKRMCRWPMLVSAAGEDRKGNLGACVLAFTSVVVAFVTASLLGGEFQEPRAMHFSPGCLPRWPQRLSRGAHSVVLCFSSFGGHCVPQ